MRNLDNIVLSQHYKPSQFCILTFSGILTFRITAQRYTNLHYMHSALYSQSAVY